MNWAFPKPRSCTYNVSTSETQTMDIHEVSDYLEGLCLEPNQEIETTLVNDISSTMEETNLLPSSSKQPCEDEDISNECTRKE